MSLVLYVDDSETFLRVRFMRFSKIVIRDCDEQFVYTPHRILVYKHEQNSQIVYNRILKLELYEEEKK